MPPDKEMGPLYGGFILRPIESMPDRDRTKWEATLGANFKIRGNCTCISSYSTPKNLRCLPF